MSDSVVRYAFYVLSSKYQSWWARRVDTDAKRAHEVDEWTQALQGLPFVEIKRALYAMRGRWHYRPPYAGEFREYVLERLGWPRAAITGERVAPSVHSDASREFFREVKSILGA
jgi:hypothetical protein